MKKIRVLVLVANGVQLPIIKYLSNREDIHLITIDNNPHNPGHKFADEFHIIDVYDPTSIIKLLKKNPPDAIIPFASSHAVESASIIGEFFNIPHIPLDTINLLSSKETFRNFLKENNFETPLYKTYNKTNHLFTEISPKFNYPIIIKPVDNGANRGITKIESFNKQKIKEAVDFAFEHSPSKNIIIEEFINSSIKINGDGVMNDGILIYSIIGDYIYNNTINPILSIGTIFPSKKINIPHLNKEIERLLNLAGLNNGVFNVEAIIKNNKIYFIEFNTRHSGNYIYKLISEDCIMSAEEMNLRTALGDTITKEEAMSKKKKLAYLILATSETGKLNSVILNDCITNSLLNRIDLKPTSSHIEGFKTLADRIGVLLLDLSNFGETEYIYNNYDIKLDYEF